VDGQSSVQALQYVLVHATAWLPEVVRQVLPKRLSSSIAFSRAIGDCCKVSNAFFFDGHNTSRMISLSTDPQGAFVQLAVKRHARGAKKELLH